MKAKNVLYLVLVDPPDAGHIRKSAGKLCEQILSDLDTADISVFEVLYKRFSRFSADDEAELLYEDLCDFFEDPLDMGDTFDDDEDDDPAEKAMAESKKIHGDSSNFVAKFVYVCVFTDIESYDKTCQMVQQNWFPDDFEILYKPTEIDYQSFTQFYEQILFPGSSRSKGIVNRGPSLN